MQNAVRLMGGQNKFEGRVEVCQDGQWKTVCNDKWGKKEARVVCRQLGFAKDARSELIMTDIMIILLQWNFSQRTLPGATTHYITDNRYGTD